MTDETDARRELAACYRLFDHLGWTEAIFNHITLRVGGADGPARYLINPFGLHYAEVTAANLVCIDIDGRIVGEATYPVNPAGFVIHGAIHAARADAHCVMHVHTTAGSAVACKASGLRHDNFYSAMLWGQVGYHEYEGVTTSQEERPRLVAALGDKYYLILRNHGLLVAGPTVAEAFQRLWTLQRACEVQLASDQRHLEHQGTKLPISPGMPVEVGIVTGERTVMQYLLKPVLRGLNATLQER